VPALDDVAFELCEGTKAIGLPLEMSERLTLTWSEVHALRIDLYLHQQGLDTTTRRTKTR
jgi:hypothetical protein